ncbi:Hypothetical predicted protein, partial [Paramuricea clavata]
YKPNLISQVAVNQVKHSSMTIPRNTKNKALKAIEKSLEICKIICDIMKNHSRLTEGDPVIPTQAKCNRRMNHILYAFDYRECFLVCGPSFVLVLIHTTGIPTQQSSLFMYFFDDCLARAISPSSSQHDITSFFFGKSSSKFQIYSCLSRAVVKGPYYMATVLSNHPRTQLLMFLHTRRILTCLCGMFPYCHNSPTECQIDNITGNDTILCISMFS